VNDLPHPFHVQIMSLSVACGKAWDDMVESAEMGVLSCVVESSDNL